MHSQLSLGKPELWRGCCRDAEDRGLPDLLSESYSAAAATQPSLETFTAECDVLDQAVDDVYAAAKAAAEKEVDKGPEQAQSKDEGPSKGGVKDHSKHQDAKKVQPPKEDAKVLTEGKPTNSQQDPDATQEEPEENKKASAAARDVKEPEEDAAVETPATESKPGSRGGAAATDKGAGGEPAQAQVPVSKESHPQAASRRTAAAEDDTSVSKPDGGKGKREELAEHQLPVTGAVEGIEELAESGSGTESGASKGKATGKKQAPLSDEQKAILERGDSMLAEADEADPKGIQLIRHMQVGHFASHYRPELRHPVTVRGPISRLGRTTRAWVVDSFSGSIAVATLLWARLRLVAKGVASGCMHCHGCHALPGRRCPGQSAHAVCATCLSSYGPVAIAVKQFAGIQSHEVQLAWLPMPD